eukprot:TRINITY_DN825_c0_g1_i5.p1 TRINITY_DN825_c0_g1~~TRINITY_DN825_c0_g1_i5.p1  ORF type:complete len:264 (-),score=46.93 TRINITY_DN825_c0_g1_i5:159-950(-)
MKAQVTLLILVLAISLIQAEVEVPAKSCKNTFLEFKDSLRLRAASPEKVKLYFDQVKHMFTTLMSACDYKKPYYQFPTIVGCQKSWDELVTLLKKALASIKHGDQWLTIDEGAHIFSILQFQDEECGSNQKRFRLLFSTLVSEAGFNNVCSKELPFFLGSFYNLAKNFMNPFSLIMNLPVVVTKLPAVLINCRNSNLLSKFQKKEALLMSEGYSQSCVNKILSIKSEFQGIEKLSQEDLKKVINELPSIRNRIREVLDECREL